MTIIHYVWLNEQRDNSYKGKLKKAIDRCIMTADSFDDFLKKMREEENYEYKLRGKTLSFKDSEHERFVRCSRKNFGWYYEPEQLQKRIDRQLNKRSAKLTKDRGMFEVHDENAVGLNRWAALKNMKEIAAAVNIFSDLGVSSVQEIDNKIMEKYDERFDVVQALKENENEFNDKKELLKMLNTFWDLKAVYSEYVNAKNKKAFQSEHAEELKIYNSTKAWLQEKYPDKVLPNRSVIEMEIAELESKRELLLERYQSNKKTLSELETAKEKIDKFFEMEREKEEVKKRGNDLE